MVADLLSTVILQPQQKNIILNTNHHTIITHEYSYYWYCY